MQFDGGSLGYVEDCFSSLDEFWISDAATRETCLNAEGIRSFSSAELLWTGEFADDAEFQESIAVPGVILASLIEGIEASVLQTLEAWVPSIHSEFGAKI